MAVRSRRATQPACVALHTPFPRRVSIMACAHAAIVCTGLVYPCARAFVSSRVETRAAWCVRVHSWGGGTGQHVSCASQLRGGGNVETGSTIHINTYAGAWIRYERGEECTAKRYVRAKGLCFVPPSTFLCTPAAVVAFLHFPVATASVATRNQHTAAVCMCECPPQTLRAGEGRATITRAS
ncbi:hypothetical protein EON67_11330 [archaeon]|nr:MAG: hypothetical protein EON67_11330 [archaeon]